MLLFAVLRLTCKWLIANKHSCNPCSEENCVALIRVCAAVQGIALVASMSKTRCIILCEYVLII